MRHMQQVRQGWFDRAADLVGDFSHPFYAEERQRDVWNEASALGLQLVLFLGLGVSTVLVWVDGAPSLPAVSAFVAVLGVASIVTVAYANRLGVDAGGLRVMLRWRLVPYAAIVVLLCVGMARAMPDESAEGFGVGAVTGAAVALGLLALHSRRARRREQD
jgi:hypothetical protein